ncbi:MAG: hypothetical protein WC242_02680 [Candidatus Paceibacterota bacterium]
MRKVKILKFILPLLAIGLFVAPNALALLQPVNVNGNILPPDNMNQLSSANMDSITLAIVNLRNWFAGIVLVVAVAALLFGALKYMFSGGDSTKTKDARGWIVGGVIGAIIAAVSFGLVTIVMNIIKSLTAIP